MPLYSYKCTDCGLEFDRFLPLAEYRTPQGCDCGAGAERVIKPTAVRVDYAGYQCPVSGDWIEGKKAHQDNLAKHGCRVLESGEVEQAKRASTAADEALSEKIAETACEVLSTMPSAKREQLGRELSNGADITVERL